MGPKIVVSLVTETQAYQRKQAEDVRAVARKLSIEVEVMFANGNAALQEGSRPAWSAVPLTGCDGLPDEGQRLVREGVLAATVVKPLTAGHALELIVGALGGSPIPSTAALPVRSLPSIEELAKRGRR